MTDLGATRIRSGDQPVTSKTTRLNITACQLVFGSLVFVAFRKVSAVQFQNQNPATKLIALEGGF